MRVPEPVATAASLIVRHTGAYGDLIADDVATAFKALATRFWVGVVFLGAVAFAVAMACVWVIAVTWDTPERLWAIAGLCGGFVLISVIAFGVLRMLKRRWQGVFPQTGSEWGKDRLLVDELLARARGVPDAGS
jgi:uncharacterized membrane protein YqjE